MSKSKEMKELNKLKSKVGKLEKAEEVKELNSFVHTTYTALTNAGETRVIGLIAQGDDYNQRTGREIKPYSVQVNMNVQGAQSFVTNANSVPYRIILVQDRAYNGTARPIDQILEGSNPTAGTYDNYIAGYNDDFVRTSDNNKHNPVTILKDKKGFLSPVASGYGKCWQTLNFSVAGRYLSKISYIGGGTADVRGGALLLYMFTGTSATVAQNNQVLLKHTLRFLDG